MQKGWQENRNLNREFRQGKHDLYGLYPRLNIVPLQPKEFFGWLCKSQQDATFCLFLIRNLFFL